MLERCKFCNFCEKGKCINGYREMDITMFKQTIDSDCEHYAQVSEIQRYIIWKSMIKTT